LCISSVLFDGGTSNEWRLWLGAACGYVERKIFRPARGVNPQLVLMQLGEKDAFVVKTTLWFDVLASVTLQRPPHFHKLITEIFDPHRRAWIDDGMSTSRSAAAAATVSMMDFMGCENDVFWAMTQTSWLACWKEHHQGRGTLSIPQLVMQGQGILSVLTLQQQPFPIPPPPGDEDQEGLCRYHTSAIFRAATLVWLHAIMSNDCAGVPELQQAVAYTLERLRDIPRGNEQVVRQIVRSSVFGLFMCGLFTLADDDDRGRVGGGGREYIVKNLQEQSRDNVGNCTAIEMLLRDIWRDSLQRGATSVRWREALKQSQILLV